MSDLKLLSPGDIRVFLTGTSKVEFSLAKKDRHAWLAKFLKQVDYFKLRKKDKAIIKEYIFKITNYSRTQLTKLISQYRTNHWIGKKNKQHNTFPKKYTREDIVLLAMTDEYHQTLSGGATKKLFERALLVYKDYKYRKRQ